MKIASYENSYYNCISCGQIARRRTECFKQKPESYIEKIHIKFKR